MLPNLGSIVMRLLCRKRVCDKISVSRTTLSRWVAAGRFPKPTYIGDGNKAWQKAFWLEDDVDGWIIFHTATRGELADYRAPE